MTFSSFVDTKFIPEHVQHKTLAGRTHYQAMLKHLIRPETVHRMFNPRNVSNARLHSDPDWPYLDQVRLCDLKAEHVRRLVAAAFARNYSWQTVKHIKNVAFAIIAHAQQEGCFYGLNPVSQVKLPPKTHRPTPDLSINETRAILQLLPSPEKHVALFTLSTGMNIQEICNLQWKHVNLTESPRVLEEELIPPYSIAVRMQWNRTGLGSARQSRNRNIARPRSSLRGARRLGARKGIIESRGVCAGLGHGTANIACGSSVEPVGSYRAEIRNTVALLACALPRPRRTFVRVQASARLHDWQCGVEWVDRIRSAGSI